VRSGVSATGGVRLRWSVMGLALLALSGCQVGKPGVLQTAVIQGAKRHLTVGGRNLANPLAPTPENIHS
jgi:hypothetical protein